MVHEPYLAFGGGGLRWTAAASVHRVMTAILIHAASRIWIAIPRWERRWRPYAFGRDVPFTWLPIPSSLPMPAPEEVRRVRGRHAPEGGPIVGHLSSYGTVATRALSVTVPAILQHTPNAAIVLLGQHADRLHQQLVRDHPQFAARIRATGTLSPQALVDQIGACDLLIQPYPDGVSSRRTSAMAGLALGIPVITTTGSLTESLWAETRAVSLVSVDDSHALTVEALRLLSDAGARRDLGARGHDVYRQYFDLRHTIAALRRAAHEPCASPS
jgi:glycosyltransferase involved in cell wall biosynthesis